MQNLTTKTESPVAGLGSRTGRHSHQAPSPSGGAGFLFLHHVPTCGGGANCTHVGRPIAGCIVSLQKRAHPSHCHHSSGSLGFGIFKNLISPLPGFVACPEAVRCLGSLLSRIIPQRPAGHLAVRLCLAPTPCSLSPSGFQMLLFLLLGLTVLIPRLSGCLAAHWAPVAAPPFPAVAEPSTSSPLPVPASQHLAQCKQIQHCYSHTGTLKPS